MPSHWKYFGPPKVGFRHWSSEDIVPSLVQFLSIMPCLDSVFADVQPDLITNLKTMLKSMLVMSCLVLGLTSFQPFLYYLVNFLDFFNELGCFVHIIVSISCYVFTKDKIQGIIWYKTKTSLKRRSLSRRMFCMVVSMLHITQILIPKFGMLAAISSKQLYDCPAHHFCLTIYLRIKCQCSFLTLCPLTPIDLTKISRQIENLDQIQ